MIKSIKVMLKPNNKQASKMFQYAGTACNVKYQENMKKEGRETVTGKPTTL